VNFLSGFDLGLTVRKLAKVTRKHVRKTCPVRKQYAQLVEREVAGIWARTGSGTDLAQLEDLDGKNGNISP